MSEVHTDFNSILRHCEDRNYITNNMAYLKGFFASKEHREMLVKSMGTKDYQSAVKLIGVLELPLKPPGLVNAYTYGAWYWLCRMGIVDRAQFAREKERFRVLGNFKQLFYDVEKEYVAKHIENSRYIYKYSKTVDQKADLWSLGFERQKNVVFFIGLDSILSTGRLIGYCSEEMRIRANVCRDWDTLQEVPGEAQQSAKRKAVSELLEILKPASPEGLIEKMNANDIRALSSLLGALGKLNHYGVPFFIYSKHLLSDVIVLLKTLFGPLYPTQVICAVGKPVISVEGHKSVYFGKGEGVVSIRLLRLAVDNFITSLDRNGGY